MPNLRIPDLRSVLASGRIGAEPSLKYFADGTPVASFNFAMSLYRGKGKERGTMWIAVQVFGRGAEAVAQLAKGAAVIVEGSLDQDEWTDKTTGERKTRPVIRASRVQALEWPDGERQAPTQSSGRREVAEPATDDDLPF